MKERLKYTYMEVAEQFSKLSYAKRLKVGSIIVKDDRILSIGYNGTPSGWDNNCEELVNGELITKQEVIHSEANCISKMAKSNESSDGAELFVTHSPCIECAKLINGAGIKTVFYETVYRDNKGLVFLEKCGVVVVHIQSNQNPIKTH